MIFFRFKTLSLSLFIDQNHQHTDNAKAKTTQLQHRRGSPYNNDNYGYDYYDNYAVQPQGHHYHYSSLIQKIVKGKNRL